MKVWVVLSVHASGEAWVDSVYSTQAGAVARCDELNTENEWLDSEIFVQVLDERQP